MKKTEVKRTVVKEMGATYDAQIIIDALLEEDTYLMQVWQVVKFDKYCQRFGINRKAVRGNDCWKVVEA